VNFYINIRTIVNSGKEIEKMDQSGKNWDQVKGLGLRLAQLVHVLQRIIPAALEWLSTLVS
jgi:hypothetical protein